MLNISVIILTYNEEEHIHRCIANISDIAKEIFLVDSFSTDQTTTIATKLGAHVFQNKWENNYARQFNWGLENLPIKTKWVLRLDADEYLLPELVNELKQKLNDLPSEVSGVVFKRRHMFLGKWMNRGTYPIKLLRLFKYKKGVCEQRLMDEHIQLLEGTTVEFECDFVDHNLHSLAWWIEKHNGYSIREAIDLLDVELGIFPIHDSNAILGKQAAAKRKTKHRYARLPLFWRSFAYFIYRYFFRLGFTEGKEGFLWYFLQGWWYRTLVDAKIFEIKKACGNDKELIVEYIKEKYNIDCTK